MQGRIHERPSDLNRVSTRVWLLHVLASQAFTTTLGKPHLSAGQEDARGMQGGVPFLHRLVCVCDLQCIHLQVSSEDFQTKVFRLLRPDCIGINKQLLAMVWAHDGQRDCYLLEQLACS
eukprot:scaffold45461_cov40-Prasinocladus_malaysianus.AAC.1